MPSRLSKHRPESSKLKHSHSVSKDPPIQIHQDQQLENGLFANRSSSDLAQDHRSSSESTRKSTSSRQRLGSLLHGRRGTRSTLSPASPATVNSNTQSMPGAVAKEAPASPTTAKAPIPPPTKQTTTTTSSTGQAQPAQPPHSPQPQIPTRMASTIRTVPSFDERDGASSGKFSSSSFENNNSNPASKTATTSRSSAAFSPLIGSSDSRRSKMSPRMPPDGGGGNGDDSSYNGNGQNLQDGSSMRSAQASSRLGVPGSPQPNQGGPVNSTRSSFEIPVRDSSRAAVTSPTSPTSPLSSPINSPTPYHAHQFEPSFPRAVQPSQPTETTRDQQTFDGTEGYGIQASSFDSAVGKASIGKTGRVMNKLISENDALKREIQLERLQREEAKQQQRNLEEKMERMQSEYESRLLEANVNKTLLARKERQVESLQAALEIEKGKAAAAMSSESTWKHQLQQVTEESKREVEAAREMALEKDTNYNAISGYIPGEKQHMQRQLSSFSKQIQAHERTIAKNNKIVYEEQEKRRHLTELLDQKINELSKMDEKNKRLEEIHEEYKILKEESLAHLKTMGDKAEIAAEQLLEEAKEASDQLKWALNVKKTIPWAE